MAHINIFNNNAFGMVEMTDAINQIPFQPGLLGSMGLFVPRRVRTKTVSIESKAGVLNLIQTSERGAPLEERQNDKRLLRDFHTTRIARGQTISADEIQDVRAFGRESEMMQVQDMITEVMSGPTGLMSAVEMTKENMRLGAVQGIVLDADGSTLINWFQEFGISQPAEIDFDLANATPDPGSLQKKCKLVVRNMLKAAKGGWINGQSYIVGLCGDNFFDDLVGHPEIRETFLNQQAANQLRNDFGNAYDKIRYGGILFINYRGTDDGSTIAIGDDKCKFFPAGTPGLFVEALSPAEFMPFVNTPGKDFYAMIILDKERQAWARPEIYSYPLMMCTRPGMLQRAKRTA